MEAPIQDNDKANQDEHVCDHGEPSELLEETDVNDWQEEADDKCLVRHQGPVEVRITVLHDLVTYKGRIKVIT